MKHSDVERQDFEVHFNQKAYKYNKLITNLLRRIKLKIIKQDFIITLPLLK